MSSRGVALAAVVIVAAAFMTGTAFGDSCHSSDGEGVCEDQGATSAPHPVSDRPVCAVCAEPIGPQSVQLRGEPAQAFDCIFCALIGADGKGDVRLTASSASSGEAITLTRKEGKWQASPSSAVALALPAPADECRGRRLVFASTSEFTAYVKEHPTLAKEKPEAVPLTRAEQIIEAGRPPLPEEAVCPVAKRTIVPNRKTAWTIADGEVYYFCCPGCKSRFRQWE